MAPGTICTEFSEVTTGFGIEVQVLEVLTFVIIDDPYTDFSVLVVVKTSFQLVLQNFDKMDDIVTGPLNVKFDFRIGHTPCFATIEFTKHYKTEAITHVNYEN